MSDARNGGPIDTTWSGVRVLVTGGASFIGSHLVDRLVDASGQLRIADDLSSGTLDNIELLARTDDSRAEMSKVRARTILSSPGRNEPGSSL